MKQKKTFGIEFEKEIRRILKKNNFTWSELFDNIEEQCTRSGKPYRFDFNKQQRERDLTADKWIDSRYKGYRTNGEHNPRTIILNSLKSCLDGVDRELQSTHGGTSHNLALSVSGQFNMAKNWLYILECYDQGQKVIGDAEE